MCFSHGGKMVDGKIKAEAFGNFTRFGSADTDVILVKENKAVITANMSLYDDQSKRELPWKFVQTFTLPRG